MVQRLYRNLLTSAGFRQELPMRDQVALGNEPAASRLQIKPRRSSKAQCNDKVLKKILNVGTSVLQNLFYYIF